MITRLKIIDFKPFEGHFINFKKLTMLAGSNSVGKSSIIQAILLMRHCVERISKSGDGRLADEVVPLNGPYCLEIGSTMDAVRRGVSVSNAGFGFELELGGQGEGIVKTFFTADISSKNNYSVKIAKWDKVSDSSDGIFSPFLYYLSAERLGPRLRHERHFFNYPHVGYKGENTFQILAEEGLHVTRSFRHESESSSLLYLQTRAWLNKIIPGAEFDKPAFLGRSGIIEGLFGEFLPTNVGFGISYVLPIIVNGLIANMGSIFIVENPEAHLHPKGQSEIGRFLAQIAADGVQVIIETHSEHVINGCKIAVASNKLSPDDVVINFVSKPESKVGVSELTINDKGQINSYPTGFLDQEQMDFAEIVEINTSN